MIDRIEADEVHVGVNCHIGERVVFTGYGGRPAKRVVIGDNVRIEDDCRIYVTNLEIGDYFTLHNHALVTGIQDITIGHSVWVGQNCILNGTGRLDIGNGVGIGAYSQLWTHIRHGDTLQGCRWDSAGELLVGEDAWFVGHVIVSPIVAARRSMAMVGSVVTRDMEENRTYGGAPAKDITDKVGPQFDDVSRDDVMARGRALLRRFHAAHPAFAEGSIVLVRDEQELEAGKNDDATWVAVADRKYLKRLSEAEMAFIRFAYPAKFFPV